MQGKQYMLSLTWNAPEAAFKDKKQYLFEGYSVEEIFAHNTVNYKFCGTEILPTFSCFNVVKASDFENDTKRFKQHLSKTFKLGMVA